MRSMTVFFWRRIWRHCVQFSSLCSYEGSIFDTDYLWNCRLFLDADFESQEIEKMFSVQRTLELPTKLILEGDYGYLVWGKVELPHVGTNRREYLRNRRKSFMRRRWIQLWITFPGVVRCSMRDASKSGQQWKEQGTPYSPSFLFFFTKHLNMVAFTN